MMTNLASITKLQRLMHIIHLLIFIELFFLVGDIILYRFWNSRSQNANTRK